MEDALSTIEGKELIIGAAGPPYGDELNQKRDKEKAD
jgi:hypothetical protein